MLLSLCCSVVIMLYCYCVALLLFVLSYVLIVCTVPLPPGVNPIAVERYIYLSNKLCIFLRSVFADFVSLRGSSDHKPKEKASECLNVMLKFILNIIANK